MLKKSYLVVLLVAAIGAGTAFAQSATTQVAAQKEKEKQEKDKAKEKEGQENFFAVPALPAMPAMPAVAFPMGMGESSYLGVYLEEVTSDRAKELRLAEERGAIVMKVIDGSPAEKAGLKENDVIISFNGRRVDSVRELQRLLSETPAGRNISFEVMRNGANQTFTTTLAKRTPQVFRYEGGDAWRGFGDARRAEELTRRYGQGFGRFPELGNFNLEGRGGHMFMRGTRLGISVESLTEQLASFFGAKNGEGVLVSEVHENGPASKAGLKAGDVIIEVDNVKIDGVNSLVNAVQRKEEGAVTIKILRNRNEQTVTVTLEKVERRPAVAPRRPGRAI